MATWQGLAHQIQHELGAVGDPFHTEVALQRYLEHGEMLLAIARALTETTGSLPLVSGQPDYVIHTTFPHFVIPLRVTINGLPLDNVSLASLGRLNQDWHKTPGTPESYGMVGATILLFHPTPNASLTAQVTYLQCPPGTITTPATDGSPVIQDSWMELLSIYGQSLALAKEGQIQRATGFLKQFVERAGLPRDPRFLKDAKQKPADVVAQPTREAND